MEQIDQLIADKDTADYFEAVVAHGISPRKAATWILGPLRALLKKHHMHIVDCPVSPSALVSLLWRVQ